MRRPGRRTKPSEAPHTFSLPEQERVHALAWAPNGNIWVGTSRGLYRFCPDEQRYQQAEKWPRHAIIDLTIEEKTGLLWVITPYHVGYLIDEEWHVVRQTVSRCFNKVISGDAPGLSPTWLCGAQGLYTMTKHGTKSMFSWSAEDEFSNAVQCVVGHQDDLWLGTARGLYRYQIGVQRWHNYTSGVSDFQGHVSAVSPGRDIRTICPVAADERIWVGSWRDGLRYLRLPHGVYLPDPGLPTEPVVAITATLEAGIWAATIDKLMHYVPEQESWISAVTEGGKDGQPPGTLQMGVIQALCIQPLKMHNPRFVLWVGTSNGLFCYLPDGLWVPASDRGAPVVLMELSIQALAVDPIDGMLWIGTSQGLYTQRAWTEALSNSNVRALAFAPTNVLCAGTTHGLEQWRILRDDGRPAQQLGQPFTAANSGLAADEITALYVCVDSNMCNLWIGTMNGLCHYQYPLV